MGVSEMARIAADWDLPEPPAGSELINRGEVMDALALVIDPEIGLDIVTLGLVHRVDIIDMAVRVTFTLTTPHCPLEGVITQGIVQAVETVRGVEQVLPDLVWEPRWDPTMIREELS
jgi:metal-sulfur cluster biosynthetic enzyme